MFFAYALLAFGELSATHQTQPTGAATQASVAALCAKGGGRVTYAGLERAEGAADAAALGVERHTLKGTSPSAVVRALECGTRKHELIVSTRAKLCIVLYGTVPLMKSLHVTCKLAERCEQCMWVRTNVRCMLSSLRGDSTRVRRMHVQVWQYGACLTEMDYACRVSSFVLPNAAAGEGTNGAAKGDLYTLHADAFAESHRVRQSQP